MSEDTPKVEKTYTKLEVYKLLKIQADRLHVKRVVWTNGLNIALLDVRYDLDGVVVIVGRPNEKLKADSPSPVSLNSLMEMKEQFIRELNITKQDLKDFEGKVEDGTD